MRKIIVLLFFWLFTIGAYAASDCDDKVFSNLSSSKGTTISQMLEQLSSRCSFSIAVKDSNAELLLDKPLNMINLRDFTLKDIFDFLLVQNQLDYDYDHGILKISSYTTKTFKVDYITAVRTAETTFSMGGGATTTSSSNSNTQTAGQQASTSLGSTFKADDSNSSFWSSIKSDLTTILHPVQEGNTTASKNNLIINAQAGLISITATKTKLQEAENYISTVLDRLHKQVFIDVQILSVTLNKTNTTGIDWSKIYGAMALKASYGSYTGVSTPTIDTTTGAITAVTANGANPTFGQFFRLSGAVDLTDFIKFLRTQGDVKTVSNPKVMTLNNQPALITSGDVIFYPKVTGGTSASATAGATNPSVETVPLSVGVTLDITPEIMDDTNILLKINPTSSSCIATNCPLQTVQVAGVAYNIAPNIAQKQLSSVVKAADGERIILGGLIKDTTGTDSKKVPILGDIPILGYLFKQDVESKVMEEMVIVITPHIIKKDKTLSLKELGYKSDLDK